MIRVAIIDDHPVFLHGMADVIEGSAGLELVLAASSVEDFDQRLDDRPDVVVLDLQLPGLSGAAGVGHLRKPGFKILVMSAAENEGAVVDAIGAGASGYLTKVATPDEIVRAVNIVATGGTYVSATLAGYLLKDRIKLTPREREILRLVARGETDQDIADQLFVSISTVRGHLDRIGAKTGHRRRPDLTRLAIERGLS
jgi:DNA-binding NarL/FixJ family response regulator